ncbi:MAG: glycosyltransferase family 2 protein [Anaerolineae bacterium]
MCNLSILIVTYYPGDLVRDCLRSLPAGAGERSTEVIVIDNASGDGTAARIASEFPHVRLIANADNRGFAAANNQGLQVARGRYLLLLNPDVVVHPGALAEMAAYLDDNPTVGIVGPRTLDGEGRVALTAHVPYSVATLLWRYLAIDRLFPNHVYGHYRSACQHATSPFDVGVVQGSCLMLRAALYQQIGGLDETFFLFAEENDFCARAIEAGWRVSYLPSACVTHYESSSVSRYVPVKVRSHHISPLYYFRKRGREGAVLMLKVGFTAELLAKTVLRLVQMLLRRDAEAALRVRTYRTVLLEMWQY